MQTDMNLLGAYNSAGNAGTGSSSGTNGSTANSQMFSKSLAKYLNQDKKQSQNPNSLSKLSRLFKLREIHQAAQNKLGDNENTYGINPDQK